MEELLRQRRLLAGLVWGDRPEETEERAGAAEDSGGGERAPGTRTGWREDFGGAKDPAAEAPVEMAGRRKAEGRLGGEELTAGSGGAREERRRVFHASRLAERGRETLGWTAVGEPGFVTEGIWRGGVVQRAAAEREARELSRAIQRDARRYDGGFGLD